MADAPVAPHTPAPAPEPPAPAPPPQAKPAATPKPGEIHVIPQPLQPAAPPKTGSAKARMFEELGKRARRSSFEAQGTGAPEPAPSAEPKPQPSGEPQPPEPQPPDPKTEAGEKGKTKVNPWRLVDDWKGKAAAAEKQLAELKGLVADEETRKSELQRLQLAEQRAKELEDEIRFVNYQKSPEFVEKFQKPYEQAWERAMGDLKDLVISDEESGSERAFTPQDLLELINLPLGKARELADQLYGAAADDVMAARKEVRTMFDAQTRALDEAKTKGAQREAEQMKAFQQHIDTMTKWVSDAWKSANESILKDEKIGPLLRPDDGDDEGNERLKKGFELVDRAFAENPMNPKLSPQERLEVIKRHTAVRNRAAAFGRLSARYQKLLAENEGLKRELEQYRGSEPEVGGGPPPASVPPPSSARDSVFGALRKLAR